MESVARTEAEAPRLTPTQRVQSSRDMLARIQLDPVPADELRTVLTQLSRLASDLAKVARHIDAGRPGSHVAFRLRNAAAQADASAEYFGRAANAVAIDAAVV